MQAFDPDEYFEHVLADAEPGGKRGRPVGRAETWQRWWARLADVDAVHEAASRQGFVLRTSELDARGVTRSVARTAVRRGRWSSPAVGVVSPVDISDTDPFVVARRRHALRAAAGSLRRPGHVVADRSAATLHGVPTLRVPRTADLTSPDRDSLGRRGGARLLGAGLADDEIGTWFGTPLTRVARTVVDLARHDRRDGVMAADAALREELATAAELDDALARAAGWPGVQQARAIIAFADPRAESALESLARLTLEDAGLPRPVPQFRIGPYRVDFCWPELRLVLEVDGLEKYTNPSAHRDVLAAEKEREQYLRRCGYRVERMTWDDLLHHWPAAVAVLRTSLA